MKQLLLGSTRLLRDFRRDDTGSTALTFGLGLTVMLLAMGTGIDFAMASKKQSLAQDLADQVGLAAAVYVKNNALGSSPTDEKEGLLDGKVYKVSEIGDTRFLQNGQDATVKVDYKSDEAIVTVQGTMPTTFMSLAGIKTTDYDATAVIKYHQTGVKPASVMLVLDNSGSMAWMDTPLTITNSSISTPAGAQRRIDGLETATRTLNAAITGMGTDAEIKKTIRMGMIPYDSDTIQSGRSKMGWGTIPSGKISQMAPGGTTNSAPPIADALAELLLEDSEHLKKNNTSPLKFAIFMTDGVNTVYSSEKFTPQPGGGIWEAKVCAWWNSRACITVYEASDTQPAGTEYDGQWWVGSTTWTEGVYRNDTDDATLANCDALKNAGVEVFAIGFATREGYYEASRDSNGNIASWNQVTSIESARIHSFLRDCASSPANYMLADNSLTLNAVFHQIGKTIQKRSIYVAR